MSLSQFRLSTAHRDSPLCAVLYSPSQQIDAWIEEQLTDPFDVRRPGTNEGSSAIGMRR